MPDGLLTSSYMPTKQVYIEFILSTAFKIMTSCSIIRTAELNRTRDQSEYVADSDSWGNWAGV